MRRTRALRSLTSLTLRSRVEPGLRALALSLLTVLALCGGPAWAQAELALQLGHRGEAPVEVLASTARWILTATSSEAILWERATGRELARVADGRTWHAWRALPDEGVLIGITEDRLQEFSLAGLEARGSRTFELPCRSGALSEDGRWAVCVDYQDVEVLERVLGRRWRPELEAPGSLMYADLDLSTGAGGGPLLLVSWSDGSREGQAVRWEAEAEAPWQSWGDRRSRVLAEDGALRWMTWQEATGRCAVVDLRRGEQTWMPAELCSAREVAISEEAGLVAVATERSLVLLDVRTRAQRWRRGRGMLPVSLELSGSLLVVYTEGAQGTISVLDVSTGAALYQADAQVARAIGGAAVRALGDTVLWGELGAEQELRIWRRGMSAPRALGISGQQVWASSRLEDGTLVVVGGAATPWLIDDALEARPLRRAVTPALLSWFDGAELRVLTEQGAQAALDLELGRVNVLALPEASRMSSDVVVSPYGLAVELPGLGWMRASGAPDVTLSPLARCEDRYRAPLRASPWFTSEAALGLLRRRSQGLRDVLFGRVREPEHLVNLETCGRVARPGLLGPVPRGPQNLVGVSEDGRALYWKTSGKPGLLVSELDGRRRPRRVGPELYLESGFPHAFGGGVMLGVMGPWGSIEAWFGRLDLETGEWTPLPWPGLTRESRLQLSPDAARVAVLEADHVRVLDASTGEDQLRLRTAARALRFSPDGAYIVTTEWDGRARLWDARTGAPLVSIVLFEDGSWLAVDPEGRFDRSPGLLAGAHFVLRSSEGLESLGLEQLERYYSEPGLLRSVLDPTLEPRALVGLSAADLPPEVRWTQVGEALQVELRDRGGGLGPVALRLNGRELAADVRPADFDPAAPRFEVELAPYARHFRGEGQDALELQAFGAKERVSSRGVGSLRVEAPPRGEQAVDLFALVVGTHQYADPGLALEYADDDARSVSQALEAGARALLGPRATVDVRLLSTEPGAPPPGRAAIEGALAGIAAQAQPEDILVVYLSGHGVTRDERYYYLLPEATQADLPSSSLLAERALSSDALMELLRAVPASKQLLILDTCEAGGVAGQQRSQLLEYAQQRTLDELRQRMGLYVLAAAPSGQSAYEHDELGHGLLTYALLDGLRGGQALKQGSLWDASTTFNQAVDAVPLLAEELGIVGAQRPVLSTPGPAQSFVFGQLPEDPEVSIPLRATGLPVVSGGQLVDGTLGVDSLRLSLRLARMMAAAELAPAARFRWRPGASGGWLLGGLYESAGGTLTLRLSLTGPEEERYVLELTGSAEDSEALLDCGARWVGLALGGQPAPPACAQPER